MLFVGTLVAIPVNISAQAGTQTTVKETPCVSTKDAYCLLEPLSIGGKVETKVAIADYLKQLFKIGIGLAGLFAVFMIVLGGLEYMSTDAVTKKESGKEKIQNALIGLALALGSYLILNTINPQLLEFSGGLEPVGTLATRERYDDGLQARLNNIENGRQRERALRADGQAEAADDLHREVQVVDIIDRTILNLQKKEGDKANTNYIQSAKASIGQQYDKAIVKIQTAIEKDRSDRATKKAGITTQIKDLESSGVLTADQTQKLADLKNELLGLENYVNESARLTEKVSTLRKQKTNSLDVMEKYFIHEVETIKFTSSTQTIFRALRTYSDTTAAKVAKDLVVKISSESEQLIKTSKNDQPELAIKIKNDSDQRIQRITSWLAQEFKKNLNGTETTN